MLLAVPVDNARVRIIMVGWLESKGVIQKKNREKTMMPVLGQDDGAIVTGRDVAAAHRLAKIDRILLLALALRIA
jgi:hypothetical protein